MGATSCLCNVCNDHLVTSSYFSEFLEYDIDSIDTNEKSELCLFGKLCVAQRTSRKDLANHLSEYSCVSPSF